MCWGGGDAAFIPTDNAEVNWKCLSILPGTVPGARWFLLFLPAVTRALSQERESKIVGQRVGIPGTRSGNQGPSAPCSDLFLCQGFTLPKWNMFQ